MHIGSSLNVGKAAGQQAGTMESVTVPLLIPLNKSKFNQVVGLIKASFISA